MTSCEDIIQEVARLYRDCDDLAIVQHLVDHDSFSKFLKGDIVHKAAASWAATTRRIGGPVAGEVFPDKVVYPHHCRCICEREVNAHAKAMCLLSMFSRAANHCRGPKDIPGADMMIRCTSTRPSAGAPEVSYW